MENTWYSVISPESCSSILWRSWDHKITAAKALKLTAEDMKNNGLVDGIIREPLGGAHSDHQSMIEILKDVISSTIAELRQQSNDQLVKNRIEKFCAMGSFVENS